MLMLNIRETKEDKRELVEDDGYVHIITVTLCVLFQTGYIHTLKTQHLYSVYNCRNDIESHTVVVVDPPQ